MPFQWLTPPSLRVTFDLNNLFVGLRWRREVSRGHCWTSYDVWICPVPCVTFHVCAEVMA